MKIRFYTITKDISPPLLCLLIRHGSHFYDWVDDPAKADFFVLPTNYEVGHELSDHYLHYFNGNANDRVLALRYETEIKDLAQRFGKKILVFFFSDDTTPLPIDNAIVFRTSIIKSKGRPNEFAMPAFKHSFWEGDPDHPAFLPWLPVPSVAFRGQVAGKMKARAKLKNRLNLLANRLGSNAVFSVKNNFGYLERKNAMAYLQNDPSIRCDFTITNANDIDNKETNRLFRQNVFSHPYNLCASGFGNYSYRLYEVMSAGRIPVFIDTDCQLPFEEFIDWKKYIVWVEQNEIPFIGRKLRTFHEELEGDLFIDRQQEIKRLWKEYLSPEGFLKNLGLYLQQHSTS